MFSEPNCHPETNLRAEEKATYTVDPQLQPRPLVLLPQWNLAGTPGLASTCLDLWSKWTWAGLPPGWNWALETASLYSWSEPSAGSPGLCLNCLPAVIMSLCTKHYSEPRCYCSPWFRSFLQLQGQPLTGNKSNIHVDADHKIK